MYIYLDYAVISGYRHKSFTTMFGHKTFKKTHSNAHAIITVSL